MAWTEDPCYPHSTAHPYSSDTFQMCPASVRQPTTLLQQLPATAMPGGSAPIRPGGRVKDDLVELMMIQNAQMHQVIMNTMAMSALGAFGHPSPPSAPEAPRTPVVIQEEDEDDEVYHHYYQPAPYPCYPALLPLPLTRPRPVYRDPTGAHQPPASVAHTDGSDIAFPPPPPPSAASTAGANVTAAAEYWPGTEGR